MTNEHSTKRPSAVVVGGGIAGLVAAWSLSSTHEVVLIEATDRLGGKIATTTFRDRPLDLGADAFIIRNDAALNLCRELGLESELIEPASKSAAVYTRRELHPLPKGLIFGIPTDLFALKRSGVINLLGLLRALYDVVAPVPAITLDDFARMQRKEFDPTVGEIFHRRFGRALVNALIDPLVGGINASDVGVLSLYSSMPQIAEQIAGKKSIMRALRPRKGTTPTGGSIFRGLAGGMEALVIALERQLISRGVKIERETSVSTIERSGSHQFTVFSSTATYVVDRIVLATPAYVSAAIVDELSPALALELSAIPYAGVATVTMSFHEDDIAPFIARDLADLIEIDSEHPFVVSEHLLPGSGVLVARDRSSLITAASFTSTKWPRSHADHEVVIRSSLGHHHDERALALNDTELTNAVRRELTTMLGIHAEPLATVIQRWPASFPQYVSGHGARIERVDHLASDLGIDLVGAAYHGIGLPACIAHARQAVARSVRAEDSETKQDQ